ncbi:MAG: glycosyltransferase family 4 protein, partial [Clostridiales bacterium]|nr:glycosyltransferase family 4 protein [Clostridiales bacterium]
LAAPGGRACFQRLRGAYRALGFRADPIRRQFYDLAAWDGPTLMVRSGAPIPTVEPALPTEGPLRVVFAGTLSERKRVEMLVRAMLRLPDRIDWTLRIAGDGPKRELIEQQAASPEANGRITLLGHLPREQVLAEMAQGEVFAMVSAAETLGLVYLEAMACGMVTIGTRGLGIDGIIRDGENGFLADGDEDGLAALFTRIADMPRPARHAIARRAMETALSLTEEQAAADYLAQVRRAIDGGEQGG